MRAPWSIWVKYSFGLLAAATAIVFASPTGAADAAATEQVTPDRWTRSVCREVSTWLKTRGEVDARFLETLGGLSDGSLSAKAAKTRLSRVTTQGVEATDRFIKEVKEARTPSVEGGKQVARSYLTTLADYSDAYKQARKDLARAKTKNTEQFTTTAQQINGTLAAELASIGLDPVEELRPVPELAAGISASCGDVASYLMTKIDPGCQDVLTTARHAADVDSQEDTVPVESPQFDQLLEDEERTLGQLETELGACNVAAVPAPCRRPFEDSQQLPRLWNEFIASPLDSPQEEALEAELNRQYDAFRSDIQSMCR